MEVLKIGSIEVVTRTMHIGGKILVVVQNITRKLTETSWITLDGRRIYLPHFAVKLNHMAKAFAGVILKKACQEQNKRVARFVKFTNQISMQSLPKCWFSLVG